MEKSPQMYICQKNLKRVFGVTTDEEALNILGTLEKKYSAIQYVITKTVSHYKKVDTVYIHFNICNEYIPDGNYSKDNEKAAANIAGAKNGNGFILVDKLSLFNTFYKNGQNSHGVEDLFVLLRLNMIHMANSMFFNVPPELKREYITVWKVFDSEENEPEYSLYVRIKDLAKFLKLSEKTVSRYLKRLSKLRLIEYLYLPKRGMVFCFSMFSELDMMEGEEIVKPIPSNQKNNIRSIVRSINKFIDDYNQDDYCFVPYSIIGKNLLMLNYSKFSANIIIMQPQMAA